MSVRHVDEALRLWNERLNAAAQNLIDLQAHPVYKRISTSDARFSGETAEKSALAVRTLGSLLQYFDSLQGLISRAEELRQDMPTFFGAEEREREIVSLLRGQSIRLPSIQVPFGQRSLLGGVENAATISPPDLLRVMESAFEQTKAIVLQLDSAWEAVGRKLDSAATRLSELQEKSSVLSAADSNALQLAAKQFDDVQRQACDDPLGPPAQLAENLEQTVSQIAANLEAVERQRAEIRSQLRTAENMLRSLQEQHESTTALCKEAREKTGAQLDVAGKDKEIAGLRTWLERLQEAEGPPGPIAVGLRNWTAAANKTLKAESDLAAEAESNLSLRAELRGRFEALKAKARAHSLAEDDGLLAIAERVKAVLYERPTPLNSAAALVSEYEARLNSEAAKRVLQEGIRSC